jgi:YlmC/YmxH family sporulation protein
VDGIYKSKGGSNMFRISDLRRKDIINEADGKKLGYIYDMDIEINSGTIESIIITGESRFLGLFIRSEEIVLPWDRIKKIGVDVIIVGDERVKPILTNIDNFALDTGKTYNWEEWDL